MGSEADDAKRAGNDAFQAGQWSRAVHHYSRAIDLPVPHYRLLDEGPRWERIAATTCNCDDASLNA